MPDPKGSHQKCNRFISVALHFRANNSFSEKKTILEEISKLRVRLKRLNSLVHLTQMGRDNVEFHGNKYILGQKYSETVIIMN